MRFSYWERSIFSKTRRNFQDFWCPLFLFCDSSHFGISPAKKVTFIPSRAKQRWGLRQLPDVPSALALLRLLVIRTTALHVVIDKSVFVLTFSGSSALATAWLRPSRPNKSGKASGHQHSRQRPCLTGRLPAAGRFRPTDVCRLSTHRDVRAAPMGTLSGDHVTDRGQSAKCRPPHVIMPLGRMTWERPKGARPLLTVARSALAYIWRTNSSDSSGSVAATAGRNQGAYRKGCL